MEEKMKKNIVYIIIIMTVFALSGCKSKDQATYFIPTPAVTEAPSDQEASEDTAEETAPTGAEEDTSSDEPVYVGKTTPKYVKLGDYDAVLNIRSTPSKDGEIVGFLVHTEKIDVISIENGWASFVYKNKISYVSADFLVDKKPAYLDPPTPTPSPTPAPLTPTPVPDPNAAPPEI
jgi:uncharacterized protein YgiM (DUF1202 family)